MRPPTTCDADPDDRQQGALLFLTAYILALHHLLIVVSPDHSSSCGVLGEDVNMDEGDQSSASSQNYSFPSLPISELEQVSEVR